MRFIKIGETYAVNADRIMDATYTARGYNETDEGVGEHTRGLRHHQDRRGDRG